MKKLLSFEGQFSDNFPIEIYKKEAINKKNSNASTSLSTYVWSLTDKGEDPKIKWEISSAIPMHVDLDVVTFV